MRNRNAMMGRTLVLLAAATLLLFATAARAATPLTFWTTEVGHDREGIIDYLAKVFMVFNPDVEVRVVAIDENDIAKAMGQARREGAGPDVVNCFANQVVDFYEHGWLDEEAAGRVIDDIGRKRFFEGALKRVSVSGGKPCGIPFNGWIQGIWYRKDWFAEAGLAPPDNWEAILKAAKTLHDPARGRYGILVGTRADAYAEQVFTHLAESADAHEFSPDGEVVFDSPATVRALRFYAELARYTPPGPQWWRGKDYYLQGKMAMIFYSTLLMDDLAVPSVAADSLTGDHFADLQGAPFDNRLLENTGMVSALTGTRKVSYGVLQAIGLLNNGDAARRDAARRFVRFLFQEDVYITWLHLVPGGMLPVLRDVVDDPAFFRDAQGVLYKYRRQGLKEMLEGFNILRSFEFEDGRLIPAAARVSAHGVIGRMIMEVLDGRATPEEAVRDAAAQMREIAGHAE